MKKRATIVPNASFSNKLRLKFSNNPSLTAKFELNTIDEEENQKVDSVQTKYLKKSDDSENSDSTEKTPMNGI